MLRPLTSSQRPIWYEQKLHPGSALYNVGGYVRIAGSVSRPVFEQALRAVIAANDMLCADITEQDAIPYQQAAEALSPLHYIDFSGFPDPEKTCLDWMKTEATRPLSFEKRPFFNFSLLKAVDGLYFWHIKLHHLLIDGWGISLLIEQMAYVYGELAGERPYDPLKIGSRYASFIEDDLQYRNSEQYKKDEAWWISEFRQVPESLPFRKAGGTTRRLDESSRTSFQIRRTQYNQLLKTAKEEGLSIFHLFLGLLYLDISKTFSRESFSIGLPILNRGRASFKKTIGLFAMVMPLKLDFNQKMSFREVLGTIKGKLRESFKYQRYPVDELIRKLHAEEKLNGRLFDIVLSYEKHDYNTQFANFPTESIALPHHHEQNALAVYIREYRDDADVSIDLDFNKGLWDEAQTERFSRHLQHLLAKLPESLDKPLEQIELIDKIEKSRILESFNNTLHPYNADKTLPELLEDAVSLYPEQIALTYGSKSYTYSKLNAEINKLAACLRTLHQVQPGMLIGLMMERSDNMLISLWAILKAGAAYVPIDPAYPEKRIAQIVQDARLSLIITDQQLNAELLSASLTVLHIENLRITSQNSPSENPKQKTLNPDAPAYVTYTSGSTGKPKGVMVSHSSVAAFSENLPHTFGMHAGAIITSLSNITFDISVLELVCSLLNGLHVVLLSNEESNNPELAASAMLRSKTNALQITPSRLRLFAESIGWDFVKNLQTLLIGGEALPESLFERLRSFPKLKSFNVYGPTEATIWSTSLAIHQATELSIGKPLLNEQVYILNSSNQPQPIGIPGQIAIGGSGLAKGYLHQEALTAERFVKNPFLASEKLYLTGDTGSWTEDGNICFSGRSDGQVKLRGYRIETAEIEAILREHPAVSDAIVLVHEEEGRSPSLCAYILMPGDADPEQLRPFLLSRLPGYMVPAWFTKLDKFPLTPNGKTDRKALPSPLISAETEARTTEEQLLLQTWKELLGQEQISIHDNFFSLGGDSIKAIQIAGRLHKHGFKAEPQQFFEHPSIARLSSVLQKVEQEPLPYHPIETEPADEDLDIILDKLNGIKTY